VLAIRNKNVGTRQSSGVGFDEIEIRPRTPSQKMHLHPNQIRKLPVDKQM
jgi:hypothetical protein